MISPNATSPSVTSISRWYSIGAIASPLRRRRALGFAATSSAAVSDANGHLLGQPPELGAAVLEVRELVERGAGGRQQHRVAGRRVGGGELDRRRQVAGVRVGDAAFVE